MFKKARNRIMLLNMVMVSAVVIAAFLVVFFSTYSREQRLISTKLESNPMSVMTVTGGPFRIDSIPIMQYRQVNIDITSPLYESRIMPDAGLSFAIFIDTMGNVVNVNSMVDLPASAYRQAALEVTKNKETNTTVRLEGRIWRYITSPVAIEFFALRDVSYVVSGEYSYVRFLDVTDSHQMLRSLALTLSALTVVLLIMLFFISHFFASRAIRPMEEAFEKQSRFVADASHELKTPLSIISANCSVLYGSQDEPIRDQVKWLDNITRATGRMTGLVGSLLSLARMEDNEQDLHTTTFDLSAAVSEAIAEMESSAMEKGLKIHRHITSGIEVKSDRMRMLNLFAILLDNAIKYTDYGGEVSITLKKEKRQAICSVLNSGNGISQEDLPRLFDRFYRGDPARSSENEGYGLGLSIAKATADQLGIKLLVSTEPEKFTEFRLVFDHLSR